jgi:hypothetical protein
MISTGSPGVMRININTAIATPNMMGIVISSRSNTFTMTNDSVSFASGLQAFLVKPGAP